MGILEEPTDDILERIADAGKYWDDDSEDPRDLISEWQDEPTPITYTQADVEPLVDVVEKLAWLYGPTEGLTPIIDIGKMCREALTKFQKARGE